MRLAGRRATKLWISFWTCKKKERTRRAARMKAEPDGWMKQLPNGQVLRDNWSSSEKTAQPEKMNENIEKISSKWMNQRYEAIHGPDFKKQSNSQWLIWTFSLFALKTGSSDSSVFRPWADDPQEEKPPLTSQSPHEPNSCSSNYLKSEMAV